jgi:hypothetical protein
MYLSIDTLIAHETAVDSRVLRRFRGNRSAQQFFCSPTNLIA